MRREELSLEKYDTDKKNYLKYYDPVFQPYLDKNIVLLELGVFRGGVIIDVERLF